MNKSGNVKRVVGIFPGFEPIGGVQASGRLGWETLQQQAQQRGGEARLFSYDPHARRGTESCDAYLVIARSKPEAVIKALLQKGKPDLIVIWHLGLLRLLPLLRARHAQVIVMLLGVEAWRENTWLTGRLLRRVNQFLTISDHTWRQFIRVNPGCAQVAHQTVYLGIDTPPRLAPARPSDVPTALMLSRLERHEDYKGHREMIAAWSLVLERIPDAHLWIAGDGTLRPELEQMVARHRLQNHIHLLGRVSEARKQELFEQCRCLVMPSRREGFGLVYLEAMRVGRPCLVSSLDAGREVVNPPEAGLMADPDDPRDLAEAVGRLLTLDPQWARWSAQARCRYEQHFTAAQFQARFAAALSPFL